MLSAIPGVSHRFFGRIGGTSPHPFNALNTSHDVDDAPARVDENLARVRFQLGVGKDALFTAKQVHGSAVVVVDAGGDPIEVRALSADALLTRSKGQAVGIRTADCAPILLAVDDASAVAAVHAGWRGAVGGVIEAALLSLDVDPSRVVAAVGPCIGISSFEVGPEVIAAAKNVVDVDGLVRSGAGDRAFLDLAGLCRKILEKAGITRVDVVGGCTVEQAELYFSHRRDQGKTGRQLSAVALATPPDLDDESFA
ncbi:MAG: peptidoglycan editing factor PgeF [Deltaproteobacteria bacterium]|nr:peptidoglycan editing factor PgeF [Deltaproteobacteria bacterium]